MVRTLLALLALVLTAVSCKANAAEIPPDSSDEPFACELRDNLKLVIGLRVGLLIKDGAMITMAVHSYSSPFKGLAYALEAVFKDEAVRKRQEALLAKLEAVCRVLKIINYVNSTSFDAWR